MSESPRFFDPRCEIAMQERFLPHWEQGSIFYFITWRLADSVPKIRLSEWTAQRERWLEDNPPPWNGDIDAEYHRRFSSQMERWLDQGAGSCILRYPGNATVVTKTLQRDDGKEYDLSAFVIMPNHVHVLIRLREGSSVSRCVQVWKSSSAHILNARTGRTGRLWQPEYWDRMVRNIEHWQACVRYIQSNPRKAKLQPGEYFLRLPGEELPLA